MLSIQQFERLLENPESSILDFKREMYHFDSDSDKRKISAFVKDIIAFGNTIRTVTAYIIIGVDENNEKSKKLIGIDNVIDDATLQEKVKNKIHPRPNFSFYTIEHSGLRFGVFEFPITKYSTPLLATENMKGIEVGKIYHRKGTSNSEALGMEGINIYEWLKNLPDVVSDNTFHDQISKVLQRITSNKEMLTETLPELLSIAKNHKLSEIEDLCKSELRGLQKSDYYADPKSYEERYSYRIIHGYVSPLEIGINRGYYNNVQAQLRREMDEHEYIVKLPMMVTYALKTIEGYIERFRVDQTAYMISIKHSRSDFFPESDGDVFFICFQDDYENLYRRITQKFIELLVSL